MGKPIFIDWCLIEGWGGLTWGVNSHVEGIERIIIEGYGEI